MGARVVRGMFLDSDHFVVFAKVKTHMVWRWKKREERSESESGKRETVYGVCKEKV